MLLALAACLIWLAAAATAATLLLGHGTPFTGWASAAAGVAPPLVLALIVGSLIPGAGRAADVEALEDRIGRAAETAAELSAHLAAVDAALDSSTRRTDALALTAAAEGTGLAGTAARLEDAATRASETSRAAQTTADALASLLPDLGRRAAEVEETLQRAGTNTGEQVRAVEQMLTNVRARHAEAVTAADATIGQMTAFLAQIDDASKRNTTAIATRAYALDAAVDSVLERTTSAVDDLHQKVTAHATHMQDSIAASAQQLDLFGSDGAIAIGQRIDLLLRAANQLKQHFAEQQDVQDTLHTRIGEQLAAIEGRFGAVRDAGSAAAEEINAATLQQLDALGRNFAAAQQSGARVIEDMTARIASVQERLVELKQPLAESQSALTGLGTLTGEIRTAVAETEAAITARTASAEQAIDSLAGRARQALDEADAAVAEKLAAADGAVGALTERLQRGVGEAEAHLGERLAAADGAVGALTDRLHQGVAVSEAHLSERLAATEAALSGLTDRLQGALDQAEATLSAKLAAAREALTALSGEARGLIDHTDALHTAIGGGAAALGEAAAGIAVERQHVTQLTEDLAGHFDAARIALADIHTGSTAATAHASTELIDVFLRIREMSDAAAGTMRQALGDVIGEAEKALARAGTDAAEAAFGAPVRLQVAAVEDAAQRATGAAQAASERLARQMVTLLETVAGVEAKVNEIDTRFEMRARDTLSARSVKLIDALHASSVDVAKLLSIDIGDDAWGQYLKGDRSIFTRSVVKQLDREATRRIARLFKHDPEFREEASRYLDMFETLIKRVIDDPDGHDFAPTILSSDIGKLYVSIARAIDRLPPGAA